MQIEFRECDWFNLWIWLEFKAYPTDADQQYIEQVLESWYTLGMLGGFNAASLIAQEAGIEVSYLDYIPQDDHQLPSLMHNMGGVEYQDNWARCWFDLGTADAMALDVLLCTLETLSVEYVPTLERVLVGGQNEDWPVPDRFEEDDALMNGYYSDNHEDGSLE